MDHSPGVQEMHARQERSKPFLGPGLRDFDRDKGREVCPVDEGSQGLLLRMQE